MNDYGREEPVKPNKLQDVLHVIRAAGALLGLIAILIGLVYATQLFTLVVDVLKSPEVFQAHLDKWVLAVGGEKLDIALGESSFELSRIIALSTLGSGAFILTWLSLGIIITGAKVVSWTLSDREAIRQILAYAFGPSQKPIPTTPQGDKAR